MSDKCRGYPQSSVTHSRCLARCSRRGAVVCVVRVVCPTQTPAVAVGPGWHAEPLVVPPQLIHQETRLIRRRVRLVTFNEPYDAAVWVVVALDPSMAPAVALGNFIE